MDRAVLHVVGTRPAAAVAVTPKLVPAIPRSLMIAASTGSAVIETTTPRYRTKAWLECGCPSAL
jgi:hypothetical protein